MTLPRVPLPARSVTLLVDTRMIPQSGRPGNREQASRRCRWERRMTEVGRSGLRREVQTRASLMEPCPRRSTVCAQISSVRWRTTGTMCRCATIPALSGFHHRYTNGRQAICQQLRDRVYGAISRSCLRARQARPLSAHLPVASRHQAICVLGVVLRLALPPPTWALHSLVSAQAKPYVAEQGRCRVARYRMHGTCPFAARMV